MPTAQPKAGEDRSGTTSARAPLVGKWWNLAAPRPIMDPRYRVLQRRDVREAVRVQIILVIACVVAAVALIGVKPVVIDVVALIALIASCVPLLSRRMVGRRPYETAVFSGVVLNLLIVTALMEVPREATLFIGSYAVVIVASALFCGFDQRPHLVWLAFSLGLWLIPVALAPIDAATRFQSEILMVGTVVASGAGNRLVQARRERMYATEAMLREERRELREAVARLELAMTTIANLEGVLPICAHCKRIREAGNTWVRIETYVEERSSAQFSHGICPDCAERYFPGVLTDP
jgi:hypothetical protein